MGAWYENAAVLLVATTRSRPFTLFKTQHFSSHHDTRLVVTGAIPERRIVTEINGCPAAPEYARALGMDPAALTPACLCSPSGSGAHRQCRLRALDPARQWGWQPEFLLRHRPGHCVPHGRHGEDILSNLDTALERGCREQVGEVELILGCDCILRLLECRARNIVDAVSDAPGGQPGHRLQYLRRTVPGHAHQPDLHRHCLWQADCAAMSVLGDIRCASHDTRWPRSEELLRRDKIIDAPGLPGGAQPQRSGPRLRPAADHRRAGGADPSAHRGTDCRAGSPRRSLGAGHRRPAAAGNGGGQHLRRLRAVRSRTIRCCCATKPSASSTGIDRRHRQSPPGRCAGRDRRSAILPPGGLLLPTLRAGRGQRRALRECSCPSGQALQIREHRMADGCLVGIYSDVTDLKAEEARLRQQRTGPQVTPAAIHPRHHRPWHRRVRCRTTELVAWNLRYFELLALPVDLAQAGQPPGCLARGQRGQ
jgi:hypothetical protein